MIENLGRFVDKTVLITAANGRIFCGKTTDYIYPEDNENGLESIVVDMTDGSIIEFTGEDIETIKIL